MTVVHYHLFKNAGTSFDATLRDNFPDAWAQVEAEVEGVGLSPEALRDYLTANPHIEAVSSHTALLPEPPIDRPVVVVMFLRHPVDRARSVYEFERAQPDPGLGPEKAKGLDISGYFDWRLSRKGDETIVNFQAHRLAHGTPGPGSIRERAIATLERLPFVGAVEDYAYSVARFEAIIRRAGYPKVALGVRRANVSRVPVADTLEERLDTLLDRLGRKAYDALYAANEDDMAVWEWVRQRIAEPRFDGVPVICDEGHHSLVPSDKDFWDESCEACGSALDLDDLRFPAAIR